MSSTSELIGKSKRTVLYLICGLVISVAAVVAFVMLYFTNAFGWFTENKKVTANGATFSVIEMDTTNKITDLKVNGAAAKENYVILPGEYYYFELSLESDGTYDVSITFKDFIYPTEVDEQLEDSQTIKEYIEQNKLPACASAFKAVFLESEVSEKYSTAWENVVWEKSGMPVSFEQGEDGTWTAECSNLKVSDKTTYLLIYFDPDVDWLKSANGETAEDVVSDEVTAEDSTESDLSEDNSSGEVSSDNLSGEDSREGNSNGFLGQSFTISLSASMSAD
jgi:hypothetical protein